MVKFLIIYLTKAQATGAAIDVARGLQDHGVETGELSARMLMLRLSIDHTQKQPVVTYLWMALQPLSMSIAAEMQAHKENSGDADDCLNIRPFTSAPCSSWQSTGRDLRVKLQKLVRGVLLCASTCRARTYACRGVLRVMPWTCLITRGGDECCSLQRATR